MSRRRRKNANPLVDIGAVAFALCILWMLRDEVIAALWTIVP